jgi:anti-sigma B factor antagonist
VTWARRVSLASTRTTEPWLVRSENRIFPDVDHDLQPPFSLTIARNGRHTVVALGGELDIDAEGELAAGLALVLATKPGVLTVDLRGLEFLDSTGLRAVLQLRTDCEAAGCRLFLVPGPPAVQRAFEVSGIGGQFAIADPSGPPIAMQAAIV